MLKRQSRIFLFEGGGGARRVLDRIENVFRVIFRGLGSFFFKIQGENLRTQSFMQKIMVV
jgi:hypothetical protein